MRISYSPFNTSASDKYRSHSTGCCHFAEYLDRYGLRFGITRLNKHLRGKNSVRTERILFSCEGSRNQDSGALHGVSRGGR